MSTFVLCKGRINFMCSIFLENEPVVDRERLKTILSLPSFCQNCPAHELDKLKDTRKFLVGKMWERARYRERNRTKAKGHVPKNVETTDSSSDGSSDGKTGDIIVLDSDTGEVTTIVQIRTLL